jgi:hypothetical protein
MRDHADETAIIAVDHRQMPDLIFKHDLVNDLEIVFWVNGLKLMMADEISDDDIFHAGYLPDGRFNANPMQVQGNIGGENKSVV